jgi:hypothetical protein
MGYEDAKATRLLATHCALCSRPLVDAESVERGVGPVCATKGELGGEGGSINPIARAKANEVVATVALAVSHERNEKVRRALIEQAVAVLRGLGLPVLARKLSEAQLGAGAGQVKVRVVRLKLKKYVEGAPDVFDDFLALTTPFDEGFVREVKAIKGRWDKESKEWLVSARADFKAKVWALLQKYYAGLPGEGPKGGFTC